MFPKLQDQRAPPIAGPVARPRDIAVCATLDRSYNHWPIQFLLTRELEILLTPLLRLFFQGGQPYSTLFELTPLSLSNRRILLASIAILVYPITFAANLNRSKVNKTHHNSTLPEPPPPVPARLGKRENIGYTTAETRAEHLQSDRAENRLLRRGNSNS